MAQEDAKEEIIEKLSQVKNVGTQRATLMYEQLEVRSLEELVELAQQGELTNLSGIGKATQEKILAAALAAVEAETASSEDEPEVVEESAEPVDAPAPETPSVTEAKIEVEQEAVVIEVEARVSTETEAEAEVEPTAEAEVEVGAEAEAEESAPARETSLDRFLGVLICPNCGNESFDVYGASLTCTACRREYNFQEGVADLAPPYRKGANMSQRVMESRFYSRFYEEIMRPRLTSIVTERTLREEYALSTELLDLQADSRVLDVACGTGNFTRYFAQRLDALSVHEDGEVRSDALLVGVDLSWPMLETARKYIRRDQLEERLFLVRGDATRLPMQRGAFDRLHCAGALHMMDDIDEALRNFACVLEPGGICVIGTFTLGKGLLRKLAKRVAEVPSKFHWFSQKELYQRMERAGFEIIEESVEGDAITVKARKC